MTSALWPKQHQALGKSYILYQGAAYRLVKSPVVYHVACGGWDGKDLLPLKIRIPDEETRHRHIETMWPENESGYTVEQYDWSETDLIHCWATLEEARDWRDLYCDAGVILEIDVDGCDIDVGLGGEELNHPVVYKAIPRDCIRVVK